MMFRRGLRGRARDFNWHTVIGFWCAPVIVVLTTTGMVISYAWASNLVYTITGSSRPFARSAGASPAKTHESDPCDPCAPWHECGPCAPWHECDPCAPWLECDPCAPWLECDPCAPWLEAAAARAEQHLPSWRTLVVRLPARGAGPITVTASDRSHWNAFARSTLTIDNGSVRWEPYAQSSAGQKLRGWRRFAHTGELGGLAGEAVAALASAGGAFLVWTGISLALRRLAASRRRVLQARETPDARVA